MVVGVGLLFIVERMVGVTSGVIESLKRDSREPPFVLEVSALGWSGVPDLAEVD